MGNLNINNLFIGISIEQMLAFLALVVLAALFGLMAGATIFYPLGYRRCKKDGKAGTAPVVQVPLASIVAAEEVPDTFDAEEDYDYSDDDLLNFVEEDEQVEAAPAEVEQAQEAAADQAAAPAAETAEVGKKTDAAEPAKQAEKRQRQVALVNRSVLRNYCQCMIPLAPALPICVVEGDDAHPYDRVLVKDYTFAVVYECDKVLHLVMRLHANTLDALRQAAGDAVSPAASFGADWYSWQVNNIEHGEKLVAKVLDMSYKYVAHSSYMRGKDRDFVPKGEPYEDKIVAEADAYAPKTAK